MRSRRSAVSFLTLLQLFGRLLDRRLSIFQQHIALLFFFFHACFLDRRFRVLELADYSIHIVLLGHASLLQNGIRMRDRTCLVQLHCTEPLLCNSAAYSSASTRAGRYGAAKGGRSNKCAVAVVLAAA